MSRKGHDRIGVLGRSLCFEPLAFVVPLAEEAGIDRLREAERIAERMLDDVECDLSVGRRLHVGDDGVSELPADRVCRSPFERLPFDDGGATIGRGDEHGVLTELHQHEVDHSLASRGFIEQSGRLAASAFLLLSAGVVELGVGEKLGQVDRRQMFGQSIGEQVGGSIRAGPIAAAVVSLGKIDASGSVGVAVDEDEFAVAVAVVVCSFAVLPNGESESAAGPAAVSVEFARAIKQFVSDIEQRQVPRPSAVMSVIADEAEIGRAKFVLGFELGDNLPDELIGASDRSSRRTELASAFFVADGVGLREPDDHDRLLAGHELSHGVVGVRVVDVLPSVLGFEVRHAAGEAAAPKWRRRFGHDGQHAGRPIATFVSQEVVQRLNVAGQRVLELLPFLAAVDPLANGRLAIDQRAIKTLRRQHSRAATGAERIEVRLGCEPLPAEPHLPLQAVTVRETTGPHRSVRGDRVGGERGEAVGHPTAVVEEQRLDVGQMSHRGHLAHDVGPQAIDVEDDRLTVR